MAKSRLKFAIFGNTYQEKKSSSIERLLQLLQNKGDEVMIDAEFYAYLKEGRGIVLDGIRRFTRGDFDADFVLSMGGDGTFLKAAARVGNKGIPILGINTGRLGFLADVSADEIDHSVEALHQGDFIVESRTVVQVKTNAEALETYNCALNDVSILKRDTASMITIRASVGGEYLTTYQADGLIVSTPTGSTAYSLSVGGPVIDPHTDVLLLTAVAPHSLNMRPVVIPGDAEVTLEVESRSHTFLVALDGRSVRCRQGVQLTLRKAPYDVKVIKRKSQRYYRTLREKMMWGEDRRAAKNG